MSSSTEIKKIFLHTENMESKEKINPMQKVDMVISHISDCILELNASSAKNQIPEMTKALAELLKARAYSEELTRR